MPGPSQRQIRCLTSGRTRRAVDVGIVRWGSANRKYTLGWCSQCRWLRRAVLEPIPPAGFQVVTPAGLAAAAEPDRADGGG